ncbi:MAG: 50S ribosomal protein L24 [Candidatus Micrarchaeota archaeon]|nr:50S ribosomal protein L24 [Candidatus Micrarchaeota archaeon]
MLMDSKKPRKQRVARYEAPLHVRQDLVAVHLSKELRKKLNVKRRALPVRKGDRVKVMRGRHKGREGKVIEVDLSSLKIFVEGIIHPRSRGGDKPAPLEPSNLLLVGGEFGAEDRKAMLQRGNNRG